MLATTTRYADCRSPGPTAQRPAQPWPGTSIPSGSRRYSHRKSTGSSTDVPESADGADMVPPQTSRGRSGGCGGLASTDDEGGGVVARNREGENDRGRVVGSASEPSDRDGPWLRSTMGCTAMKRRPMDPASHWYDEIRTIFDRSSQEEWIPRLDQFNNRPPVKKVRHDVRST